MIVLAATAATRHILPGMSSSQAEIDSGTRFAFGENWSRFLELLDGSRVQRAEESLRMMLGMQELRGRSFLDIGSGSGLFSLAARKLGATVYSFDFDPKSVACAQELKRRYFADDPSWTIEQGSVLDQNFIDRLRSQSGGFDIVYSWGVLHHTGNMWDACARAAQLVRPGGTLFIALYNDQGLMSHVWRSVKRAYCSLPTGLKWLVLFPAAAYMWLPIFVRDLFIRGNPFWALKNYSSLRGMSAWRDVVDWVGGLPFEVARPEEVLSFYRERSFELVKLVTQRGNHGCCEYVFRRQE